MPSGRIVVMIDIMGSFNNCLISTVSNFAKVPPQFFHFDFTLTSSFIGIGQRIQCSS